jgi:sucrose-6-phosphate hydrolase SacC (GH32 family)
LVTCLLSVSCVGTNQNVSSVEDASAGSGRLIPAKRVDELPSTAANSTTQRGAVASTAVNPTEQSGAVASIGQVQVTRKKLTGIGREAGVMRRDPSDVIKVGDLYYVWYSKGKISTGYNATVWYATSKDGINWTEQGEAITKGQTNAWDSGSVFTPNILVAEGRYWLFYSATSKPFNRKRFRPDSKIGIAVSDSPDGPWEPLPNNPVLTNSSDPNQFDSHLVDDACLIVRDGQYWLYYKGRQQGKSPAKTKMGLAIAEHPAGPYVKFAENPVIPGNHEVVVWPQGTGVAAMIGTTGPKTITNSVLYSEDGFNFTKTHQVIKGPLAGGTYRPEAFTDSDQGQAPEWGLEIGRNKKSLPFIHRFDLKWSD